MCDGQSSGFGTRAGDQQYVWGTLRVSIILVATTAGTGSKQSVVSRQSLMTSPSLQSIDVSHSRTDFALLERGGGLIVLPLPSHHFDHSI